MHDSERVKAALADIRIELKFVGGVQRVYLNGQDVSEEIRTPEVSMEMCIRDRSGAGPACIQYSVSYSDFAEQCADYAE